MLELHRWVPSGTACGLYSAHSPFSSSCPVCSRQLTIGSRFLGGRWILLTTGPWGHAHVMISNTSVSHLQCPTE